MDSGKKMLNTRYLITLFLLLFASFQTAQAKVIYNAEETVAGKLESPESLTIYDDFAVKKGTTYIATLTDLGTVDNFDGLSMVILNGDYTQIGDPLTLTPTPGIGNTSISFSFTAVADSNFFVRVESMTDSLSTFVATIETPEASHVPVPAAVWFFGSAVLTLAGFRRRKTA